MCEPFEVHVVAAVHARGRRSRRARRRGGDLPHGRRGLGRRPHRVWTGICAHAEQVEAEPTGSRPTPSASCPRSGAPRRRKNNRVFQHLSLPEIAVAVLADWRIEPVLELDARRVSRASSTACSTARPTSPSRRLLEEAGIAYCFAILGRRGDGGADARSCSRRRAARAASRAPAARSPSSTTRQGVATARRLRHARRSSSHEVRAGTLTLRDFDFRRGPTSSSSAEAQAGAAGVEAQLEQYHYLPGAFVRSSRATARRRTPTSARAAPSPSAAWRPRGRAGKRWSRSTTNCIDLAPGVGLLDRRPPARAISATSASSLVARQTITGHARRRRGRSPGAAVLRRRRLPAAAGHAEAADRTACRARSWSGPPGEEIHTDEFGRVRVQFHWDREGAARRAELVLGSA